MRLMNPKTPACRDPLRRGSGSGELGRQVCCDRAHGHVTPEHCSCWQFRHAGHAMRLIGQRARLLAHLAKGRMSFESAASAAPAHRLPALRSLRHRSARTDQRAPGRRLERTPTCRSGRAALAIASAFGARVLSRCGGTRRDRVSECEVSRVALNVGAHPVGHVAVADAGVRVGVAHGAAGSRRSE
jgi:hypothetical protein